MLIILGEGYHTKKKRKKKKEEKRILIIETYGAFSLKNNLLLFLWEKAPFFFL
jgi:hypothetical protein